MRRRLLAFAWFLPLLLPGCGGGGATGNNQPGLATALVPIGWTQRAREFSGPESALSAVVTFDKAGASGADVSFEVDRNAAPAAYVQTYPTTAKVETGVRLIRVRFHALAGGVGSVVGEADASVTVGATGVLSRADGSALGTIQAAGTVASILIVVPSLESVGQATNILTNVFDATGNVVAVSPGSIFFQVTPGTGSATINASGQIVGSTPGTVSLVATVDGVSSAPLKITIEPAMANLATIAQPTNDLVLDPRSGHLWASVPSTDPAHGNSVIEVDPATQTILTSIFVGSEPTSLALSDDGSALYVSLQGASKIARVDPVGKKLASTFDVVPVVPLNSPYAGYMSVMPGDPNVLAVSEVDRYDSGLASGCIYSNGALLLNNMGVYGFVLGFTSATTLWTSNPGYSPPDLYMGTVGPNGSTLQTTIQGVGGFFKVFGGNLFLSNGQVFAGSNGSMFGTFDLSGNLSGDVTADLPAKRAFFLDMLNNSTATDELQVFDTDTFKPVASLLVPYPSNSAPPGYTGLTRWGAKGLAFRDSNNIYLLAQAPGL